MGKKCNSAEERSKKNGKNNNENHKASFLFVSVACSHCAYVCESFCMYECVSAYFSCQSTQQSQSICKLLLQSMATPCGHQSPVAELPARGYCHCGTATVILNAIWYGKKFVYMCVFVCVCV